FLAPVRRVPTSSPPFRAVVQVKTGEDQGRPHQQADQVAGVLEGQVGGGEPHLLGQQRLALGPAVLPLQLVEASGQLSGRAAADAPLHRPAAAPPAAVIIPAFRAALLPVPGHVALHRAPQLPPLRLPNRVTDRLERRYATEPAALSPGGIGTATSAISS